MATVLVVAALGIVTSLRFERSAAGASRYASGSGTPGPAERERAMRHASEDARGEAPWALSALPECFRQVLSARGSPAFAEANIPANARLVRSGVTMKVADCRLDVLPQAVRVSRGRDRLRIPPRVRLFTSGPRGLVLERYDGRREEVRVYASAPGAGPVVTGPTKAAVP